MYEITAIINDAPILIHNGQDLLTTEKIIDGKITDEKNAISSMTFEIYPNNPVYETIQEYSTKIEVYNTAKGRYEFKGRVLQVSPSMDEDGSVYKSVVCESGLGYLNDSVQPYTPETYYEGDQNRNGLQEFIDLLLENHNSQVEENKRIYRGVVDITAYETTEGIYKGLNYETTWECIKSKLIDVYGGEIQLRETNGVRYLDYKNSIGTTRATMIELSKNMVRASLSPNSSGIITRLIPLGSKLSVTTTETDEDGNVTETTTETEERLTIGSVNGGVDYIEDSTAIMTYSIIYGTHEWDDVSDPNNLLNKAEDWLAANNYIPVTNSIDALDLSQIGLDIDDFVLYDKYPVKNSLIGLDSTLEIVKKVTNINEPYLSSFDMGESVVSQMDSILKNAQQVISAQEKNDKNATEIKNINNSIRVYVDSSVSSAVSQSAESIQASVERATVSKSDYDMFTETVRNILSMDADGTTMLFQTINEAINDVNNSAQTNYNNILKYIRFVDGSIILGKEGNQLTLTIENGQILFKYNGVTKSLWQPNDFEVGNIKVKVNERAQFGNFAFIPRSDGSLSLLKVGG